ncbi:rcc01693 family protein [Pseudophaeobacter sp.]|uniref:rcc01693 family protein n=1 Tax=Pseudophaeobacter sp. TaxID=1971739 RepID=UPI0032979D85
MTGLDWPGLMRAGLGGLHLRPADFWDLTPLELQLLLGGTERVGLDRSGLDALMRRFPDGQTTPLEDASLTAATST